MRLSIHLGEILFERLQDAEILDEIQQTSVHLTEGSRDIDVTLNMIYRPCMDAYNRRTALYGRMEKMIKKMKVPANERPSFKVRT